MYFTSLFFRYEAEEENTWEPIENLDCEDKIKVFEVEYKKKGEKKGGEKRKSEAASSKKVPLLLLLMP